MAHFRDKKGSHCAQGHWLVSVGHPAPVILLSGPDSASPQGALRPGVCTVHRLRPPFLHFLSLQNLLWHLYPSLDASMPCGSLSLSGAPFSRRTGQQPPNPRVRGRGSGTEKPWAAPPRTCRSGPGGDSALPSPLAPGRWARRSQGACPGVQQGIRESAGHSVPFPGHPTSEKKPGFLPSTLSHCGKTWVFWGGGSGLWSCDSQCQGSACRNGDDLRGQ